MNQKLSASDITRRKKTTLDRGKAKVASPLHPESSCPRGHLARPDPCIVTACKILGQRWSRGTGDSAVIYQPINRIILRSSQLNHMNNSFDPVISKIEVQIYIILAIPSGELTQQTGKPPSLVTLVRQFTNYKWL